MAFMKIPLLGHATPYGRSRHSLPWDLQAAPSPSPASCSIASLTGGVRGGLDWGDRGLTVVSLKLDGRLPGTFSSRCL